MSVLASVAVIFCNILFCTYMNVNKYVSVWILNRCITVCDYACSKKFESTCIDIGKLLILMNKIVTIAVLK
jgi:hypothetical protein